MNEKIIEGNMDLISEKEEKLIRPEREAREKESTRARREADEIEANAKVEEEVSAIKLEEEAWLKEFERKINRGKGRERGE